MLKDETILEEPSLYLGADYGKHRLPDGTMTWSMASSKYTAKAIANVELGLGTERFGFKCLPKGVKTPITADYRPGPEIDATEELNAEDQNYYQGLVGILRWICELGRLDIVMPVSLMSRYLAQARRGHLNQVLHLFAYLKHHGRSNLVFDAKSA